MALKKYGKFFEEITIKGHPSFSDDYIRRTERESKDEIRRQGYDRSPRELGMFMMQKLSQLSQICNGKEEELSELATEVITSLYKDIIDRYEIELDLKIVEPTEMKRHCDECEGGDDDQPEFREIVDEDIKNEIFKRKALNLITQGEGKNTKYVLHMPEVKEGIERVLGRRSEEAIRLMDEISKIASALDWIVPYEEQSRMIEEAPMSGVSKVEWKPKPKKEDDFELDTDEEDFSNDDEDKEYDPDDYVPNYQDPSEETYSFDKSPIVKARAVDFVLLLHEAVKGIYRLLFAGSIPEDEEVAKKVEFNTGIKDEPEDWRYGPKIASDIRDFVNKNPKIDKYPNVKEEVYKIMSDKETMPTKDFLELVKGILSNTEEAKIKIDSLVNKAIKTIEEFNKYQEDLEKYKRDMEDYKRDLKEWEESQKNAPKSIEGEGEGELAGGPESDEEESDLDRLIRKTANKELEDNNDPSTWSRRELQAAIDDALDSGDFDKVRELSKYIKESVNHRSGYKYKK